MDRLYIELISAVRASIPVTMDRQKNCLYDFERLRDNKAHLLTWWCERLVAMLKRNRNTARNTPLAKGGSVSPREFALALALAKLMIR